MNLKPIHIAHADFTRIQLLLAALRGHSLAARSVARLRDELARAVVVPELPATTVGLGSTSEVRDLETGELDRFTLTLPERADAAQGRLSLLAPLGTALLGYAEGDEFAWEMPGGVRRLRLERVTQPADTAVPANR